MSNVHADYYADGMVQVETAAVENVLIAEDTFRIRVAAPDIAAQAVPGQFVMIRMAGVGAPLIGRALAIYDVIKDDHQKPTWIDLVYLRKGSFTTPLSSAPTGTPVVLWGPLGNGFSDESCDHLIMAVGGIGQTPMLLLGREALGGDKVTTARASGWAKRVSIIYGARQASLLAGVQDFQANNFDVTLCTDDGSVGQKARVPDVLASHIAKIQDRSRLRVVTCGPEIMMQKVAELCDAESVACQVSMETPMACGIGICFSCVARVNQPAGDWDYKRTCVEGPIFDANKICWG